MQLDAKKSPLALLAQTCSQIGADSPNSKPLIPPLEKPKKSSHGESSPPASNILKCDKTATSLTGSAAPRTSPESKPLGFKPYEANVLTKKCDDNRPPSKTGSVHSMHGGQSEEEKKQGSRAPSRKSASPAHLAESKSSGDRAKSASPAANSPIIRSGLEILQGYPKDLPLGTYKLTAGSAQSSSSLGLAGSLGSLCSGCPPGLEPTNPAFRPAFAGGPFSHHHAAAAAAMLAASSYQTTATNPGPYVSYARVKTASGGEALVPVCKDPYCTGCQLSMHNVHQQLLLGPCPSGCSQCDHHKYGLAAAAALSALIPPGPPPPISFATHQLGKQQQSAAGTASGPLGLLSPHSFLSSTGLHRGYPNPPLSPISAARYHPYSKPGLPPALPNALAASPFSAFNPTSLGPYYSPYSVYGQRLGAAAAVHP